MINLLISMSVFTIIKYDPSVLLKQQRTIYGDIPTETEPRVMVSSLFISKKKIVSSFSIYESNFLNVLTGRLSGVVLT